jgi:acyl carrier protein
MAAGDERRTGNAAERHSMTDQDILERLTDICRYIFDYDGDTLTQDMTSDDIEAWDSMSNITLAIEIEKRFGIKIKMAELEKLKSVRSLVALIKSSLPISTS